MEIRLSDNISYNPETWKLLANGKEVIHNPMYPYTRITNQNTATELKVDYEELLYAVENLYLLSIYFGESRPDILKLEATQCQIFQDWMRKRLKKEKLVQK